MPNPPAWLLDPETRLARKNAFDASLAIGTARFNQSTGRLARKAKPFAWAIDKDTGMIRADLCRPRRCPVCDTPPKGGLFVKDGFRHVRCPECGLIYVSLILREDVLENYWQQELAWLGVLNSDAQLDMDRLKFNYGLDLAASFTDGRRALDVGTGAGTFVRVASEAGWRTTALDMNLASTGKLADEGFQVIVKPLEMADLPPASLDLITLWEVLEHLPDPRLTLAEARRILAPGGVLLIMVPNVESLVTRLLHEKSNTFGGHSHLNHFSPSTLTRLLTSVGLSLVNLETVITELGTINNHLSFEDPYEGPAPFFHECLSPKMIHGHLWGSRILALARPGGA